VSKSTRKQQAKQQSSKRVVAKPISIEGRRALNEQEAAAYAGLSRSFLRQKRLQDALAPKPTFCKIGRKVVYLRDDLDRFLEQSRQAA
jgi:hypothetical protein